MNMILYALCKSHLDIMNGWIPCPSTTLAKRFHITLYRARKELRKLKEDGLVLSDIVSIGDGEEGYRIIRGYTITEKAFETPEYQKAFAEEKQIMKECFGIDIHTYY